MITKGNMTDAAMRLHTSGRVRVVDAFPYDVVANSGSGKDPCRFWCVNGADLTGVIVEFEDLSGEIVTFTDVELVFDSYPAAVRRFTGNTTAESITVYY